MNQHATFNTVSTSSLASRSMIVSLKIRQWSGRKLDRSVTSEVNDSKHASSDAGRYNKALMPSEAMIGITKAVTAIRTLYMDSSLPWIDKGGRIMANEGYLNFTQKVNAAIYEFEIAVSEFLGNYDYHVAQAQARLGDMFDITEFPTVDELRDKFSVKVNVMPVPDKDDFRVDMSEAQAAMIRADIEKCVQDATAAAIRDVYKRVVEVSQMMVDRLNAYKGNKGDRMYDSLVGNVRDLIETLPALNITGDPALTQLAKDLEPLVEYEVDTLKKNPGVRADVAAEAQAIVDRMSSFI